MSFVQTHAAPRRRRSIPCIVQPAAVSHQHIMPRNRYLSHLLCRNPGQQLANLHGTRLPHVHSVDGDDLILQLHLISQRAQRMQATDVHWPSVWSLVHYQAEIARWRHDVYRVGVDFDIFSYRIELLPCSFQVGIEHLPYRTVSGVRLDGSQETVVLRFETSDALDVGFGGKVRGCRGERGGCHGVGFFWRIRSRFIWADTFAFARNIL
mmetsp:Transcript_26076/g.47307  ORF Transcript_26076/g.47307 Transcript_26076/m.47307 type:complete len:209 (-) Transcript_26076:558-1184(-)